MTGARGAGLGVSFLARMCYTELSIVFDVEACVGNTDRRNLVYGVVLGVLSGLLLPTTSIFSVMILLPTIMVAYLGVMFGVPAAIAATASHLLMSVATGGAGMTLIVAEGMLLPAWGMMYLVKKRVTFERGVLYSVLLVMGAMLLLITSAWIVLKGDLAEYLADYLRAVGTSASAEAQDVILSMLAQAGVFGVNPGVDFSRALTAAERAMLFDELRNLFRDVFQLSLVPRLMSSCVVTGAVGYWLLARGCARRGVMPRVDYKRARKWRIPTNMAVGLPVCALVCYLLYGLGMGGADTAYLTFYQLCVLVFCAQGIGAIARRMHDSGVTSGWARALVVLAALFATDIIAIIGVLSQLFGSEGIVAKAGRYVNHDDEGDGDK